MFLTGLPLGEGSEHSKALDLVIMLTERFFEKTG